MLRSLAFLVAAISCLESRLPAQEFGAARSARDPSSPHWISRPSANGEHADRFRLWRSFSIPSAPHTAKLRFAADFCFASVEINGRRVADVEPYAPTIDIDVLPALQTGENELSISVRPVDGPTAVALSMSATSTDGKIVEIVTDDTWSCAAMTEASKPAPATSLGQVDAALWGIGRRPATIDAFDNYEQWRQASGDAKGTPSSFWIAPGFELHVVREARPEEGSWVSMCFDPKGRLIVAREDKGLLRMTLSTARDSVETVEVVNDQLLECRGLLYAHDSLFACANNSKGLYRLRDSNGQDLLDEVTLVREFAGGVGHGRNDLTLGPDGKIYFITGDDISIPTTDVRDLTSPIREARRGQPSREGWLGRIDPDGRNCEVVCAGMRNPFGVAFNAAGQAFTYDADAEFDMGTPWYRPTRVLQLEPGSDFGWRAVTGQWPPYFPDHPDVAPPTLDIGKGSPTSVIFGTETNFPKDYRRALFILDWAYGRVLAVHLAPRGLGFRTSAENFLKGRPLNVTDIAVGPDGDLYLITGGRKTQAALYRVRYHEEAGSPAVPSEHEAECETHSQATRTLGAYLQQYKESEKVTWDNLRASLDSDDPQLRSIARGVLERLPVADWRESALNEQAPTARLESLTALARNGEPQDVPRILDRLLEMKTAEISVSQTRMLLNIVRLCETAAAQEVTSRRERIIGQLDPLLSPTPLAEQLSDAVTDRHRMRWELAGLLASLRSPGSIERTLSTLVASDLQEDQLAGLFLLRNVDAGWTLDQRRAWLKALDAAPEFVSGEGMPRFLDQLRQDFVKSLSEVERGELASDLKPRIREAEAMPAARPAVKRWAAEDFGGTLESSGSPGSAERGAAVFRDALCAHCHRFGSRGPSVGPDLTHAAGRFSRRDILESILSPSKVVAENYRAAQIATIDGETFTGRVIGGGDYRSEIIRLATKPLDPSAVVEIHKRKIESIQESKTSTMPESLLDGFTKEEVLDLLEYLTSQQHSGRQ
jgi:putative heme-binding domain-containing protein